MNLSDYAVVLVGHGGLPADCPEEIVSKLKRLESQRRKNNQPPSEEEIKYDSLIRNWPRTEDSDPYKSGLESVANIFRSYNKGMELAVAYNEFCAPTIKEAVENLMIKGFKNILLVSTMFTPGGSHSEIEIPEEVEFLNQKFPGINIEYAWPFDLNQVATFLSKHILTYHLKKLDKS